MTQNHIVHGLVLISYRNTFSVSYRGSLCQEKGRRVLFFATDYYILLFIVETVVCLTFKNRDFCDPIIIGIDTKKACNIVLYFAFITRLGDSFISCQDNSGSLYILIVR